MVSVDFIFFGLTGAVLLRGRAAHRPVLTLFFIGACWITVLATIAKEPATSLIGLAILAAGVPVYFLWTRKT